MTDVEEEYRELTAELGIPLESAAFPQSEIDYLHGRVPPRLQQFLSEVGHATYLDGAVTVCRPSELTPILAVLFKADADLNHKDCTVVSYGAFGELSVWSKELGLLDISLVEGLVFSQSLAPTVFKNGLVPKAPHEPDLNVVASYAVISQLEKVDFLDFRGNSMFARCVAAHGRLSLGLVMLSAC